MSTVQAATCPFNAPLLFAGLSGGLSVVLGALGSHAFLNMMDASQLKAYNVANQYHLVHSVAMMVVAALGPRMSKASGKHLCRAYCLFAVGTLLVSVPRYVHSTLHNPSWLIKLPPIGGVILAAGWGCIAAAGMSE